MDLNSDKNVKMAWLVTAIVILIIILDQALKIWVKTHFYLGEDHPITSWFHLKFIQNNGMAFGMEIISKWILTIGRIISVILFIWWLKIILRLQTIRSGFYKALALIIAGAAGNVFDCIFYGEIFNNPPPPAIASIFPKDGGYGSWFQGQVVDMLYFPFFTIYWPDWIPVIGGTNFEFFQYIFNVADASICVGVFLIIFFYAKDATAAMNFIFKKEDKGDEAPSEEN